MIGENIPCDLAELVLSRQFVIDDHEGAFEFDRQRDDR